MKYWKYKFAWAMLKELKDVNVFSPGQVRGAFERALKEVCSDRD
jgi:hypothetical protein